MLVFSPLAREGRSSFAISWLRIIRTTNSCSAWADSFGGQEDRVADNTCTDNRYRTLRRNWRRQTRVSILGATAPFLTQVGQAEKLLVLREIGTQSSLRKHASGVSGELRTMTSGLFHTNLGMRRPRSRRIYSSYVQLSAETSSTPVCQACSCRSASMWPIELYFLPLHVQIMA